MPYSTTSIILKIVDQTSFNLLLRKDGSITRQGDGTFHPDSNVFTGMTTPDIFEQVIASIDEAFLSYMGKVYDLPDKKGKTCSLEIMLGDESATNGLKIMYGDRSLGPPEPVAVFVEKAIQLTDPWYKEQRKKQVVAPQKKRWQFWK